MFKLPKLRLKGRIKRAHILFTVELGGIASVLTAIGHYNWPAALAVGGLGAILAVERQSRG